MTFLQWLQEKDIDIYQAAEMIGCSPFAVRKWIRRERTPRPETIIKIKKLSRGAVNGDSWLKDD
jgi:uncharacterized protein YjcR